ncbi:unnamed protein product, partial [Adineta ricciae]
SIANELSALYSESDQLYSAHMNNDSLTASPFRTPNRMRSGLTMIDNDDTFDNTLSTTICNPYEIRTLNENNMARKMILPVFPPDGLRSSTTDTSSKSVHLLLTLSSRVYPYGYNFA